MKLITSYEKHEKELTITFIGTEIIDFIMECVEYRMKNSNETKVIGNCVDLHRQLEQTLREE